MALQCGIVGLPNVGKSTLFNCLSNAKAQAANFPFCTIEPNVGVVTVPDARLARLAELDKPERVIPATVDIVDIAGLVKGASKGEGLGNKFLANIRETHAIIHVLRCFEDENVTHVDGTVDPVRDKEIIDIELQLRDLESVQNRYAKLSKQLRISPDKSLQKQVDLLKRCEEWLSASRSIRDMEVSEEERLICKGFELLTQKPTLYVCNVDPSSLSQENAHVTALRKAVEKEDAKVLVLDAQLESEIAEIDDPQERLEYMALMNLEESGVTRLIKAAYSLLQLETYFTTGKDETRAWTYRRGAKAPQAAGIIHSDFEKGFIRAEVIKYDDYARLGSESACREAGKIAVEGKEYVVQDGDIMHFRFNVSK